LEVLNRAKDRALNHLSHELRTPLAAISGSLALIEKKLKPSQMTEWEHNLAVAKRNLTRIRGIQNEAEDIIRQRQDAETDTSKMGPQAEPNISLELVDLVRFIGKTLERMRPLFSRRGVDISIKGEERAAILMDSMVLAKIFEGLFHNALENTPDEGRVEIVVERDSSRAIVRVCDFGVGITEENQKHIFSGFYPTQPTEHYSSKRPCDFNAGGKGLDLLRMKIFSERYPFDIFFESRRCLHLSTEIDLCPGRISECKHCRSKEDCRQSGGSIFVLAFSMVVD
jgi:signal transduction histidine kinase